MKTTIQKTTYGTYAIAAGGFRKSDNRVAFRDDLWTAKSDGRQAMQTTHVTGANDFSPVFGGDYNSKCGMCYLGGAHSDDKHARG